MVLCPDKHPDQLFTFLRTIIASLLHTVDRYMCMTSCYAASQLDSEYSKIEVVMTVGETRKSWSLYESHSRHCWWEMRDAAGVKKYIKRWLRRGYGFVTPQWLK